MKFSEKLTLTNGEVNPDPVSLPANVPPKMLVRFGYRCGDDDRPNKRLIVGLDAPTTETTTFTVYALNHEDSYDDHAITEQRWYKVGEFTALAGGVLDELTEHIAGGGTFYIRQTSDALTAPRQLNLRMTA